MMTVAAQGSPARTDLDVAWRALEWTRDSIGQADRKVGLTLASVGVVGGALYTVARRGGHIFVIGQVASAIAGGALLLVSAVAGIGALWSRLRVAPRVGAVFFGDVVRRHRKSPDTYVDALRALTGTPDALVAQLAVQIWANSHIAARKFRWANVSLAALCGALVALAGTAILRGL